MTRKALSYLDFICSTLVDGRTKKDVTE